MSKFGGMRTQRTANAAATANENAPAARLAGKSSRDGKKLVGGHFDPAVSQALKILAAEQGTDLQSLLGEAIDDLMRKHGKPSLGLSR